ncbi:hypothetical protein UFOVP670_39 [uncultured Caudovirales phage]|uniref:Uncharacterized protein n=1 Tax=uncultured Caudovirales phage TaxID=2100421 RepID=A0A6J5NF80_9CAUD|nr:hypothetical protein UFOVP670_39 [uncultured Caudovirales phage]
MIWFGQSEMVIARNQPSLFDLQNSRDIAGTNRDNRDILALAETRQPGQSGTPPLKGGVQCPAGTVSRMSRVPCPGSQSLENRNDEKQPDPADAYPTRASIKTAFDAWQAAGEPWPPPAGLTSAIASNLIPRANRTPRKWR